METTELILKNRETEITVRNKEILKVMIIRIDYFDSSVRRNF